MECGKPLAAQEPRLRDDLSVIPAAIAVALLAGLGVFAYFASVVVNFPGEVAITTWVQSWRSPWLDTVMKAISVPGLLVVAAPVVIVASAALYVKGWRAEAGLVLVTAIGGRLLTLALKELVARPRPPEGPVYVLQETSSYSFPSGHVMHYVVFFGILAVVLTARLKPGMTLRLSQVAVVVSLIAIGLSRIYLGMHWAADVAGGYVFGAAVVTGAAWVWRRWGGNWKTP